MVLLLRYRVSVTLKYRLVRAITGFNPTTGNVLILPPGETVSAEISKNTVGLVTVYWNGNPVSVFREDIERNGLVEPEEPLG